MQSTTPEPKDKLDAMTGYSFTTAVWNGSAWVRPAITEVGTATPRSANGPKDRPVKAPGQWENINWRSLEGQVRRVRGRGFKGGPGEGGPKGKETQKTMCRRR